MMSRIDNGPMLNAYPDSVGGNLSSMVRFLQREEVKDTFDSFYILPSLFNTDLDRGFSIIDYSLNELMANEADLNALKGLDMDLKLDFVLNHCSVISKQFQDIIKNGKHSKYCDFFINWNTFWDGKGTMTEEGYLQPNQEFMKDMFFRKPGLPILMVRMPDGTDVPYWNTFYQQVNYPRVDAQTLIGIADMQYASAMDLARIVNAEIDGGKSPNQISFGRYERYRDSINKYLEGKRKYMGQMDLNIQSPLVWEFYDNTLKTLANYGAKIVRLDAFAYAPKAPGEKNFMNEPGTWDLLKKVQSVADQYHLQLLPEIHASYQEKVYEKLAEDGYMIYDFFLPGLIIDAMERKTGEVLKRWADEILEKQIRVVNMLGCHDGIPLLDLKGLIPDGQIEVLIDTVVNRGGYVKNLHGKKNMYYQVNATYYSALGEDDNKMLLARAIQIFMPGKPQVWYLDLFAGKNDYKAVELAGPDGHKEINRTNLSDADVVEKVTTEVVKTQISLLQFRNTFPAFSFESKLIMEAGDHGELNFVWQKDGYQASLKANLVSYEFEITGINPDGQETLLYEHSRET